MILHVESAALKLQFVTKTQVEPLMPSLNSSAQANLSMQRSETSGQNVEVLLAGLIVPSVRREIRTYFTFGIWRRADIHSA